MVNHQILISTLLAKGISGTALQWFVSYPSDRSCKVMRRGEVFKSQTSNYWGASGLSSSTLLCLHGITMLCPSETWLFISLLCWWHSTLPLIPSWWSNDSCLHLSLSNIHLLLDEGPSPLTQPCQDRTACGSSKPIIESQVHHKYIYILNADMKWRKTSYAIHLKVRFTEKISNNSKQDIWYITPFGANIM